MFKKLFMQWRQILFSFVIVLGAFLWIVPFSVLATTPTFDLCYFGPSPSDKTCPPGTIYSSAPSSCVTGQLFAGKYYEHNCLSSVNPCDTTIGKCSTSPCLSGSFVATNCVGSPNNCPTSTPIFCVDSIKFAEATQKAGGTLVTGNPVTGTPPLDCTANPALSGCKTITVGNPLSFSTVEGVLGSLLGALQGIIVVLSLVFIVIGAVLYITSAGDDGRMKVAKGAITAAVIGLALGIAAPSFLKQIGLILGWGPVDGTAVTGAKTITEIALNVLNFLLSIVGILGIIMLIIGGIMYLTAAGDEDRIDTGKSIVKYAIIGIAVALAALVVVTQIANFFA